MLKHFKSLLLLIFILSFLGGFIYKYAFEKTTMDIFFVADDNYAPHLGTTMASILINSDSRDAFNFYVLESNISTENKEKFQELKKIKPFQIEFIYIDKKQFKDLKVTRTAKETYYRYLIPIVKEKINKALYLDSDLIIKKSLRELWKTDISDAYVAAVKNGGADPSRLGLKTYFNAGILLFNTQKMREDNMTELLFKNTIELDKKGMLHLEDQDVLNYTFNDKVVYVPTQYNYAAYYDIPKNVVIIHFVIYKPWSTNMKNAFEYFDVRQKTPWKTAVKKQECSVKE